MLDLIRIIIAAAFLFFIPGYLITLLFFKKTDKLERIGLSFGLSIIFAIFLGLILGFSSKIGLNSLNLWISYGLACSIMLIIHYKRK